MRHSYSRLQSVEEKRNLKATVLFTTLTVAGLILLIFVGIPLFGRLTVFISDLRSGNKAISKNDTTPPAPPKFNYFPAFTNQPNDSVSGSSEPGATVNLTFNGANQQVIVDKDGNFAFNLTLTDGDNTFSATAVDASGNVSQKSKDYTITLDTKAPNLTITSPSDGSSFFGSNQRQVTIQGTTDVNDQVVINDRIVSVDDTGGFQYTTSLNDGANSFVVKATDQAGNSTEKDITLNFNP